jgi:hypothetical protein
MTTRNNSLLVARFRQPMHVRMGTCELSVMVTTQNSIASATESRMAPQGRPPVRAGQASGVGASSDRMSMRQPVRRAARRAFWPSLPMASDSW